MFASPDQPHAPAAGTAAAAPSADREMQEFINSRINFERLPAGRYGLQDFKLDRMRELLARLGDPQQSLPAVHIAGTKGKGSTAAMTAAMLSANGYRVGLFTSPHLESIGERMTVDGALPTADQLREIMAIVPPVVQQLDEQGPSMRPTFFECITAIAWLHFLRREVDVVVLEVGLGGRLDATNVCRPLVTVITSISRDHQRLLGRTLTRIASEKAGIIKPGVPVLSGVTRPGPASVIRAAAARQSAPLFELDRELFWSTIEGESTQDPLTPLTIKTRSPWGSHHVRLPLSGRHQAVNALLALSACDLLAVQGFPQDPDSRQRGLRDLHWPLRIEVLQRRPLVIVDAAHNDGSIDALIETLTRVACRCRRLIFATSRDKDTPGLLSRLNRHVDQVILTQYQGNPRSVPLDMLRSIAASCLTVPCEVAATPADAWRLVCHRADEDDLICATGSFFLASEMRAVILAESRTGDDH